MGADDASIVLDPIVIYGSDVSAFIDTFGIYSVESAQTAVDNFDTLWNCQGHLWNRDGGRDSMQQAAKDSLQRLKEEEDQKKRGTAQHIGNRASNWRAVSTLPDYCEVGDSTVGFDSSASLENNVRNSPDVKAQSIGRPVYKVGDQFKDIDGDAGAHVNSGTSQSTGHVKILTGQDNVKVNGQPVARDGSMCQLNCDSQGNGGTTARLITENKQVDSSGKSGNDNRPGYDKALDEAGLVVDETIESVKESGILVWSALGTSEQAQAAQAQIGQSIVDTGKGMWQLVRHPIDTGGAIIDAIKEKDAEVYARNGNWGRASYWVLTAAKEVVGGKGGRAITSAASEAAQVGKIATTTSKAEQAVAKTTEFAAAAQKHLDRATDLEKQIALAKTRGASADEIRKLELERQRALKSAREANEKEAGVHVKKGRLLPNHTYEINGYTYKTDAQGRVVSVEGQVQQKYRDSDGNMLNNRNSAAQREVGIGDGRRSGDQGGHLIGDQFDGTGGKENLVPMDGVTNGGGGKWGRMEADWAKAVDRGDTVHVKIDAIYSDDTMRPSGFNVTQTINGKESDRFISNGN